MADRIETDLIVEAISKGFDQLSRDLDKIGNVGKEAGKGMEELNKAGEKQKGILDKVGENWKTLVGGYLAAKGAIETVKKSWEFAKEGAQIEKIANTFDSLTASIGETSSVVLTDMKEATASMVADTELMSSANRFLSMGLATTGDEASKLAGIAVTLGSAMGKNATASMEEFALLLANQSIPRLDTFGISAGKVRERIQELQDANENMSRETAFMTAVMEEAQISMERLGNEVPVDAFSQMETEVKNVTDELKLMINDALKPVVGYIAATATETRSLTERQEALQKAVKDGTLSQELWNQTVKDAQDIAFDAESTYTDLEEIVRANTTALNQADEAMLKYGKSTKESNLSTWDHISTSDEFNDKLLQTEALLNDAEQATREFQSQYTTSTEENVRNSERFRQKVDEIKAEILGIPAAGDTAAEAWGRAAYEIWKEANEAKEEIERINAELDKIDGRSVEATITTVHKDVYERYDQDVTGRIGGYQAGGYIPAGRPAFVGEVGPEIVRFSSGAHVTPSSQISNTNNRNVINIYTGMDRNSLLTALRQAGITANARARTIT